MSHRVAGAVRGEINDGVVDAPESLRSQPIPADVAQIFQDNEVRVEVRAAVFVEEQHSGQIGRLLQVARLVNLLFAGPVLEDGVCVQIVQFHVSEVDVRVLEERAYRLWPVG